MCLLPGGCLLQWGGVYSRGVGGSAPGGGIPACTEVDRPVNRITHTPVKTLPWHNFFAAGNNPYELVYGILTS